MIKNNKWKLIISSAVILLPVLAGLIFWDALPEQMTTHWGVDGNADGWSVKSFAVLSMPLIMLAVHWFCILFTVKDPKNKDQNRKVFGMVLWICPVITCFASGITYADAFGKEFNMEVVTLLLMGLMFVVIGNYLPKCKQNFTIGIKVKWALANEENWNATHRLGGKVWVIGGLLLMACIFLPEALIPWALIILLPIMACIPAVYSYVYYKRQAEAGTVPQKAEMPVGKWSKIATVIISVIVGAVLAVLIFFALSADFQIVYGDTASTVNASGWSDLTVEYDSIEAIEYRDTCTVGERTFGFGPSPVQMGTFENSEFGSYTRYTHANCEAAVVLTAEGKILVISGTDPESTEAIYKELTARQ